MTAQTQAADEPIEFSISAQPLSAAISRYGDATRKEALYDASLARGRYSNNVQGLFTPAEALERLLAGTGLSARFVSKGRFVIESLPVAATQVALPLAHRHYYGLVQQALLDTLCRLRDGRPGYYRIAVTFRIAPNGALEHPLRVGSTGTAQADQQIDTALRDVRFSKPPPAGFAQPIRIVLAPEGPGAAPGCASADVRFRESGGTR